MMSDHLRDNLVLPFAVAPLGVRGRVVRLGSVIDEIVKKHDYPQAVSRLLAEAVSLTAILGSALKFEGKLILQAQSDGPVSLLVADYTSPGNIRGYAHFDAARVDDKSPLLGKGHLALTIDQGEDMEQYQGIVELDGQSLAKAADSYFEKSEQLPSLIMLAGGLLVDETGEHWRAGGIMVQYLAAEGASHGDDWTRARVLAETARDDELLDPVLDAERLLYRLYHEDGVTVYTPQPINHACTCSRDRMFEMLKGFSSQDRKDMEDDGRLEVTCQFCSNVHEFKLAEFE